MSTPDSLTCSVCGHGGEGRTAIHCDKCRVKFHTECIKVTEAYAEHISKYECEKCSADGVQVFEYDMRNVIGSSPRKLRSNRGKRVSAKRLQKSKLLRNPAFSALKALGKPADHRPDATRIHQGHQYHLSRNGDKAAFWNCSKRGAGCEARLATSLMSGRVIRQLNEHSHPPAESAKSQNGDALTKRACDRPSSTKPPKARGTRRHKGYVFMRDHRPNEGAKLYWYCQEKYRGRCIARIHTYVASGEVALEFGKHNHSPEGSPKTESSGAPKKQAMPFRNSSTTSHIELSKLSPGQPGLRHKGYAYNRGHASKDGTKQYWYCKAPHAVVKCPGRVHTSTAIGEVLEELGEHNHPPVGPLETELVLRPPLAERSLRHKGFVYYRDVRSYDGSKRYWYCSQKSKLYCLSRVHTSTDSGEVVHESGQHNHQPMDVEKKDLDCSQKDTPKMRRPAKRHTLNPSQHSGQKFSKKRRASYVVDTNHNRTLNSASASVVDTSKTSTPSMVSVVQRLMDLPDDKRASATSLFSSLMDEIENAIDE